MNEQKDNQINGQKDTHKQLLNPEEVLLGSTPQDLYLYRKIEKICGAIHLLTTFFDAKEPIRVSLREKSLNVLSLSLALAKTSDLSNVLNSLSFGLIEIKSLLNTSFLSGLISEMNHQILRGEVDQLFAVIESKKQSFIRLPISFLHVPEVQAENRNQIDIPQPQIAPTFPISNIMPNMMNPIYSQGNINQGLNSVQPLTKREVYKGQSKGHKNMSNTADHSERTEKILSLLKDGRALTIKDFSDVIKGCSEKTLQRELLKLVSERKIIKRGERRWSRYSLNLQ